jgi:hypothetical protein
MPHTVTPSDAARALQALRKTRKGGRKRITTVPRCPCGVMTLRRAQARGKSSEHGPSCAFYPSA